MSNLLGAGWGVLFDGVYLSGSAGPQYQNCSSGIPGAGACTPIPGTEHADGCLTSAPDGLGIPPLRTNDMTLLGQDGVEMIDDYYQGRILTFSVTVSPDHCGDCPSAREKVQRIVNAFSRKKFNSELVIFPNCPPSCGGSHTAAYGFIGRPRAAQVQWLNGRGAIAQLVLRFDVRDQRAYMLNGAGDPGSGTISVSIPASPFTEACSDFPRCFDSCFSSISGVSEAGVVTVTNPGSVVEGLDLSISTPTNSNTTPLQLAVMNVDYGEALILDAPLPGTSLQYSARDRRAFSGGDPLPGSLSRGEVNVHPGANRIKFALVGYTSLPPNPPQLTASFRPSQVAL